MRILVLVGSPRKGGNTEQLADAFIEGARSAGAEVTRFSVHGKRIAPCVNCDYCKSHDGCAIRDDMTTVYDLLLNADAVVFATPVYFYTMTAQMKAILDRLYNPVRQKIPVRFTALLSVCADDTQEAFEPLRMTLAAIERFLGWKRAGEVTVTDVEAKGAIQGHPALAKAQALGETMAKLAL